jgi:serine protease
MKYGLSFLFFLIINPVFSQGNYFVTGELIVRLKKDIDIKSILSNNFQESNNKIQLVRTIDKEWNFHLIKFDTIEYSNQEILTKINKNPDVLGAQLNYLTYTRSTEPNDPLYFNTQKWVMDKIHAPELWDLTTGGKTPCGDDPVIAVLDFGFDINHGDLTENLWVNEKEIANDGIDNDNNGYIDDINGIVADRNDGIYEKLAHGTSCLGVIGGVGDNNRGIVGINWNTKMMLLGHAYTASDMIKLYSYVKNMRKLYRETNGKKGAYIVATSMSLGFSSQLVDNDRKLLCDVFNLLGQEGILNVVATTNSNSNVDDIKDETSICTSDYLIVVTSINFDNQSSRGFSTKSVDLAAPGEKVGLLSINNSYFTNSGTSYATPLVAGAIGLFYTLPNLKLMCEEVKLNPTTTPLIIKNAILNSVSKSSGLTNRTVSGGILNVWEGSRALNMHYNTSSNNINIIEKVYLNSLEGKLIIDYNLIDFKTYTLNIFNTLGVTIFSKKISSNEILQGKIEIDNFLISGIFIASIFDEENVFSKKFVLN